MLYRNVQYLTLLRAMASSLELESITGMRAMTHMPPDERAHLIKEREQAVELLCNRCAPSALFCLLLPHNVRSERSLHRFRGCRTIANAERCAVL